MPSLSTSGHIRQLAAKHGISEVEDETDRFATAISNLGSSVPAEIGAIDDVEMVRLALELSPDEDLS